CTISLTNALGTGLLQFPAQTRGGNPVGARSVSERRWRPIGCGHSDPPPFARGPGSYTFPLKPGEQPRGSSLCERTTVAPNRLWAQRPTPVRPGTGLLQFPAQTRGATPWELTL